MPEKVEITRHQIIVVDKVGTNSYGDLTWTDKENKPYKVKSTRTQYFEAIVSGQAVEISFAKYKGTEYPYSAEKIVDKLPDKVLPDEQFERLKANQEAKGEPTAKAQQVGTCFYCQMSASGQHEPNCPSGSSTRVKTDAMTKSDWAEKDRITRKSIERQKSLELAVLLATSEKIEVQDIEAYFHRFEELLEGNELVEEARKLIKKGG